jgi:hypothetical protein
MARGGHGLPKVLLGPGMPYPSTPCGQPSLKRPYGRFRGDHPQGRRPAAVFCPLGYLTLSPLKTMHDFCQSPWLDAAASWVIGTRCPLSERLWTGVPGRGATQMQKCVQNLDRVSESHQALCSLCPASNHSWPRLSAGLGMAGVTDLHDYDYELHLINLFISKSMNFGPLCCRCRCQRSLISTGWAFGIGIWNLAFGIWHLAFGIWAFGHLGIWAFGHWAFGISHLGIWAFGHLGCRS